MKYFKSLFFTLIAFAALLTNCNTTKSTTYRLAKNYQPDDQQLYDTIVKLDRDFFEAYNTCNVNLDTYSAFFSDKIEFYHDQGGLMTSKPDIISATKRNICGKVTRELVKGSIEVYPIKDFGAIEMGLHTFHNNQEPAGAPSKIGRFIIVWENTLTGWKIKRVVSLH